MTFETLLYDVADRVATITLNRPERYNAIERRMPREIRAAVELADADAVRTIAPDLGAIAALEFRCVVVTARADRPEFDCVSRVFGPAVGIPEDPVTGSAHCTLAPFWSERTGRTELVGEQASARGGIVRMKVAGDRVILGGRAVTVSNVKMLV